MPPVIRTYAPAEHEPAVLALWERCLEGWPVPREVFRSLVGAGDAFVACDDTATFGFVSTQRAGVHGSILVVLVAPGRRRGGWGRRLVAAAEAALRRGGATDVRVGGGADSYFWCGLPADLPGAPDFFRACGWKLDETSFDLLGQLSMCTTPAWVWERARSVGVTVRRARPADLDSALAFERAHFPAWAPGYEAMAARGEGGDIVIAVDAAGCVVGLSGVLSPRSASWRARYPWPLRTGRSTGGVGALGVDERRRGQGVGLALAAHVTECLRAEGLKYSYVGWTWLLDWYGHLGYRGWQKYALGSKVLR